MIGKIVSDEAQFLDRPARDALEAGTRVNVGQVDDRVGALGLDLGRNDGRAGRGAQGDRLEQGIAWVTSKGVRVDPVVGDVVEG